MKTTENQRLKELRISVNQTLREFGDRFGVSGSNIQNIESGNQPISIKLAKQVVEEFKVSLDWLYGYTDNPTLNNFSVKYSENPDSSIISEPVKVYIEPTSTSNNEQFYKQIIQEKDQRIQMYESFLKSKEEDLSNCREQVMYFKNLYDQAGNKK